MNKEQLKKLEMDLEIYSYDQDGINDNMYYLEAISSIIGMIRKDRFMIRDNYEPNDPFKHTNRVYVRELISDLEKYRNTKSNVHEINSLDLIITLIRRDIDGR